jgi:hypothetical protein
MPAILGDDERDAALLVQTPDHRSVGVREHVDDRAFGPAAAIDTDAASRGAIAVQQFVHLARRQEQVGTAIVGNQEAEAVGMTLDGAGDEVELGDDAELALAIDHQLAVALHCLEAVVEAFARARADTELAQQIARRHRHAGALQRRQDRRARGHVVVRHAAIVGVTRRALF